ncbi:MAG: cytochrome c biogenesis protein CcsA [Chloroflexota bacterium]
MQSLTAVRPNSRTSGGLVADRSALLLGALALLSMAAALYAGLVYAPTERIQGNVQRIFYFHVPLAWASYLAFFVVLVASCAYLIRRNRFWDALARSSAEVGLLYTTLMLISGSLWARPIWGTWWSWDARLTTTLLLWFIYVGYLMLRSSVQDEEKGARYAAVIGIVGAIDIPIIHQSVVWWRSLHPESVVLASGGPAMPTSMLTALIVSLVAFTILYGVLVLFRLRLEMLRQDIRALRRQQLELAA